MAIGAHSQVCIRSSDSLFYVFRLKLFKPAEHVAQNYQQVENDCEHCDKGEVETGVHLDNSFVGLMNIYRKADTEEQNRSFDKKRNSVEEGMLVLLFEPVCQSGATATFAE